MKNETNEFFDTITPYGYGGHLCSVSGEEAKKQIFTGFFNSFSDYAKKEDIVCEFVRFHPLLETQNNNTHFLNIREWTKTIYIDLNKDLDVLWKEMRRDHKYRIKKAKSKGMEMVIDEQLDEYETFTKLYIQTMKRKTASKYYLFTPSFFQSTKNLLKDNLILIHAKFEGQIIGSSLFMIFPPFMHYHLSSTDENFLSLSPNTYALFKAMEWGNEKGLSYLHLGGGLEPDDSLYSYKFGFSKLNKEWHLGNKIYNDEAYSYITSKWENYYSVNFNENDSLNFFPLYRKIP